jgi:hypothetical protein
MIEILIIAVAPLLLTPHTLAVGCSVAVKAIRPLRVARRQRTAAAGGMAGKTIGFRPQVAVV